MITEKSKILTYLGNTDGFMPLTLESDADTINRTLGMERNEFVAAVQALLRDENIELTDRGIRMKVKQTISGVTFRRIRRRR